MSDEKPGIRGSGAETKSKTFHWRSDELNELISRIDSTLGIKRFYKGRTECEVDLRKVPRELVSPEYLKNKLEINKLFYTFILYDDCIAYVA